MQKNSISIFCSKIFLRKRVVDFFDLTLLKDPIYVNIVLGISLALFSDMYFFVVQPLYLTKLDFDKARTTILYLN